MPRWPRRRPTAAVLFAGALTGLTLAQEPDRVVRLESLDVSDNVYLLRGGGTNILALIADRGVVLVDTLGAGWGAATRAALDNLTDRPVTTIINTHAHLGHTGGNPEFPSVVEIVAHENARRRMAQLDEFRGENARFLPGTTLRDSLSLLDGFDRMELHHFGAAHTDGDLIVVFPEKGMAYLGDLFARRGLPSVDHGAGGSGLSYPDALSAALAELRYFTDFVRGPEVRTFDRIVPGHEEPPDQTPLLRWLTWADLERYESFTRDVVDAVANAHEEGGGVDVAVAATRRLAAAYPDYGFDRAEQTVRALYDELGAR